VARFFVDPGGFRAPYSVVLRLTPLLPRYPTLVLVGLAPVLMVVGVWGLWRDHRRTLLTMLVAPFLALLAASAIAAYPFGGRTSLFLLPATALLISAGAWYGWSALRSRVARVAVVLAGVAVFVPPMRESLRLPYYHEELRDVVRYVQSHREPGDVVYVYYGALDPLHYYEHHRGMTLGPRVEGIYARGNPERYREDLRRFAGARRLWVVLAHDYAPGGTSEWAVYRDELQRMGGRVECYERPGAQACLHEPREHAPLAGS
jgi:hypothetical protein